MNSEPQPIPAPQGAIAWTPDTGYLYEPGEVPIHVETGAVVLVVSDDGQLRGVKAHDRVPLAAVLRVEGDIAEVVMRLDDLGDHVAGIDTSVASDSNGLRARTDALVARVERLTEMHARLAERVSDIGDRVDRTAG